MALAILTTDGKGISEDWISFLKSTEIDSSITTESSGGVITDSTRFVATPTRYFGLKFTSAANVSRFKIPKPGPFTSSNDQNVVLLSLEQNAKWEGGALTLERILTAFIGEPKVPGMGLVSKMLTKLVNSLTKSVPVSLVNDTETRNGMWCVAGQTRSVSTALIFSLALKTTVPPAPPLSDQATAEEKAAAAKKATDDTKDAAEAKAGLANIKRTLQDELGIDLGDFDLGTLTFHLQRTSSGAAKLGKDKKALEWLVTDSWALTIQVKIGEFNFWLQQDSGDTSVTLTQADRTTDIWTKLSNLGSKKTDPAANKPPSTAESKPAGPDIVPTTLDLLSISLGRNLAKSYWWKINTVFQWGGGPNSKFPILIGLSYDSLEKSFVGELLTRKSFQFDKKLVTYRPSADVQPVIPGMKIEELKDDLLLSDIFPEADQLPSAVPNTISVARVAYTGSKDSSTLGLQAILIRAPKEVESTPVPCPFTWDMLAIYAQKVTTVTKSTTGGLDKKASTFSFGAAATFTLNPREDDPNGFSPAHLDVLVNYNDGQWRVEGHVEHLHFGVLAGFMDESVRDEALDILGKLSLTELDVFFTYKAKQPSSFLITGTITLGALELRLFYQYVGATAVQGKTAADLKRQDKDPKPLKVPPASDTDPNPETWQLRAYLGAAGGKTAKLGEIIDSIAGKGEGSDVIPEFVKSIDIEPASSGADSAVSLEVGKNKAGAVVFVLSVNAMGIKFSYMQISSTAKPADGLPGPAIPGKPLTTRLLRITVDKLPLIKDIPLVSQLGQPFEKMLYLYVSGAKGLLQHELEALNDAMTSDNDKLVAKRAVAKPSLTNPVINRGHHFMIIQGGDVVLDHVFNIGDDEIKPKTANTNTNAPKALALRGAAATTTPDPSPGNTPSKGSLTKTLGPLTISGITLEYKSKILWIHMDATLTLGPISLGLLGFGIGFLTTGIKLNNLSQLASDMLDKNAPKRLHWELRGMSLAFDRPPVLIAGMFEHDILTLADGSTSKSYKGGVGIGFPPYTFIGVGEYSDVTKPNNGGSYKSIFLFAKLDGPLVTLEFATISGVRLGFGFNGIVRSPRIDELTEFPFIKSSEAAGASKSPMAILKSMTPSWVTPRDGSYWLAAGLTVSSFDILAVTAVAMFAFRDSGVVISIFANAVAQLPPHVPDPAGVILYIEMGMVAEMNLIDGYFRVEASLAPSSYLLVPQCHLTGGFALAYWFGNNPNAGDFVFSVGGYHRAFTPPPYYPVPTRLGISFVIGDNIQMRGESYFAITPKAAMAGALIHVSLSVGPVSAHLDASFDALINFHPFHYIVEFSVSIGVECDIDIWFIHIHISIHIGADLHIEGPEFGGIAHVDFWFFGFDIEFGARIGRPPPLELLEFWKTTHQPGPGTSERQDTDANPVQSKLHYIDDTTPPPKTTPPTPPKQPVVSFVPNAAFKFILEDGNFPMPSSPSPTPASSSVPSTGAGAKWFVKGGTFRLGVTTEFAISSIRIPGTTDGLPDGKLETQDVYSSPMHVTEPITSHLTVTIERVMPDGTRVPISKWRDVLPNKKAVPVAMWAKYDEKLDVMRRGPRSPPPPSLLDGQSNSTRTQTLGVSMTAPEPTISVAKIPKFKASAMARLGVQNIVTVERLVDQPDGSKKWQWVKEAQDWYIPDFEDEQKRFLGRLLTEGERKLDAPARWEAVKKEWIGAVKKAGGLVDGVPVPVVPVKKEGDKEEPKKEEKTEEQKAEEKEDSRGFLSLAADVFGWSEDANRPVGEEVLAGENPPWLLKGQMPKKLVNGLTDFYLALPRVCV